MTIFRALLAVLFAVPSFSQVRVVPVPSAPSTPGAAALTFASRLSADPFAFQAPSSLFVSVLPAAAAPQKPAVVVPAAVPTALVPSRTAANLRDDADRLYASLAAIHSRAKAGAKDDALKDLKLAFLGDFDGVAAKLTVAPTGDDLRGKIKELRRYRVKAEKALAKAPVAARVQASQNLAAVSGELAAHQLKAARELLDSGSPVNSKAWKRNAALWSLVGAHNSAATAAVEAAYQEALAKGETAFGDGRPYLYWNRWRNIRSELETAARDARNGREKKASASLVEIARVLRGTKDVRDAKDAAAIAALAANPESAGILAVAAKISHPTLKVRAAVAYEDMNAGLRAQVHTLDSTRADYLETASSVASLRRAAVLLSSPRPSAADKKLAKALSEGVSAWAGRGRVDAKRAATTNINAAAEAAARGDLALAARHLTWAADALQGRLGELERIALSVRRRLLSALGS